MRIRKPEKPGMELESHVKVAFQQTSSAVLAGEAVKAGAEDGELEE